MADHRPNRYDEGDVTVYRASALGSCVKSLVALGMGMTPDDFPPWLLVKFQQGIDGEPVVIDSLRDCWRIMDEREGHQYQWDDGQLYVEIRVGSGIILRGHADGIGTCFKVPAEYACELRDQRLIEVKCTTEDYGQVVLKNLPVLYQWQISVYMHFFKLKCMLALGIKDDKGEVVNVVTQMIDEPPFTLEQVMSRIATVERAVESGELPKCDYRQWPCQFPWLCDENNEWKAGATADDEVLGLLEESIERVRIRRMNEERVKNESSDTV